MEDKKEMTIKSAFRFGSVSYLVVLCALTAITAAPSMATSVTFAQYIQLNGAMQQWSVSTTDNVTTVTGSGAVLFDFSNVSGLPFSGAQDATFTITASSTQLGNCGVACAINDSYAQPGYSGTFEFTDTALGTDLLSGVFAVTAVPSSTGAQFSSTVGSTGGDFNASSTADDLNQLVLSSAYLNFTGQTQENASWSLSSLLPNFSVGTVTGDQAYPGTQFNASGTGTFSSNPGPNATPEPSTLFLSLIGGGLVFGLASVRTKVWKRLNSSCPAQ
jgi:hypothetical protein